MLYCICVLHEKVYSAIKNVITKNKYSLKDEVNNDTVVEIMKICMNLGNPCPSGI